MKSLKYIALIGLLCAGLTTLARADVITLATDVDLGNAGDGTELTAFQDLSGHDDAEICFKSATSGTTTGTFAGGSITISLNADNTIQVTWDMAGTGGVVCGFLTKDGSGTIASIYQVLDVNGQGTSGTAALEVPGNGGSALSHLTVFCCPGGVTAPDGGATVMLLGAGLGALGLVRRYLKS